VATLRYQNKMQAIISLISGVIGFLIIIGMQINIFLVAKFNSTTSPLSPTVYSTGIGIKVMVLVLGGIAIISSILYLLTQKQEFRIINRCGLLLGIAAILLCFIPFYLIIN